MISRRFFVGASAAVVAALAVPIRKVSALTGQRAENEALRRLSFGMLSVKLLGSIELTASQRAVIGQYRKELLAANKEFEAGVFELRQKITNDIFSASDLRPSQEVARIADAREEILQKGLTIALEVKQLLTQAQLAKMTSARQQLLDLKHGALRGQ